MRQKGRIVIASIIIGSLLVISAPHLFAMDGPDLVELESLVNIYGPVTFDHALHVEITSCAACHHHTTGLPVEDEQCLRCHKESDTADEVTCAGCHPANQGNAKMEKNGDLFHLERTSLKRAYHLNCLGCHNDMDGPTGCEDCHSKRDGKDDLASVFDRLHNQLIDLNIIQ